jgi:hypothetical protein
MRLAAQFSFKNGLEEVRSRYPHLLAEVTDAVSTIDATLARTKVSKEKTMTGQMLYSP